MVLVEGLFLSSKYFFSSGQHLQKCTYLFKRVCVCVCVFFFSCRVEFPAILFQVLALVVEDVRQHSMEICLAPIRWNHETSSWVFSLLMQGFSTLEIRVEYVLFPAAVKVQSE